MADAPATRRSLLVRVRNPGNDRAWSQFVAICAPVIYGFARKKGLQDADGADVTQDVLRAVSQAVRRLDYDPQRGSPQSGRATAAARTRVGPQAASRHLL